MSHPLSRTLVFAAAVTMVIGFAAAPSVAGAAATPDTTGPTVGIPRFTGYVAGTRADIFWDPGNQLVMYDLKMAVRWTASDASGICGQTVTERSYDTLGGDFDPILGNDTVTTPVAPDARSYPFNEDFLNYLRVPDRYVVRVTDCAGNTTTSAITRSVVDVKDDDEPGFITYTGRWGISRFPGFADGATHFASAPGAVAAFMVDGGAVGLVMEKAANRGSAKVFVDGVLKGTVDTYSVTTKHRQVVWSATLPPGRHFIRVVNSATPGHPRIDVDAILR